MYCTRCEVRGLHNRWRLPQSPLINTLSRRIIVCQNERQWASSARRAIIRCFRLPFPRTCTTNSLRLDFTSSAIFHSYCLLESHINFDKLLDSAFLTERLAGDGLALKRKKATYFACLTRRCRDLIHGAPLPVLGRKKCPLVISEGNRAAPIPVHHFS